MRHKVWRTLPKFTAVLTALLMFAVPVTVSYGQAGNDITLQQTASLTSAGATWTQPIPLGYGWFPDVFADLSGRVHVAWSSGQGDAISGEYDTVVYSTSMDGQTWSEINDIAARPSMGAATRPAIFVDSQGVFHLTFRDHLIYYSQALARSISAASLASPVLISDSTTVGYYSRLARDGQGILHLVYTQNVPSISCAVCFHLFYRQSTDSGQDWSSPVDISILPTDVPTGAVKPQILIDKQNNIHVVWEAGRGGDAQILALATQVMYTASYDGGKTWTTPLEFVTPDSPYPTPTPRFAGPTPTPLPVLVKDARAENVAIGMDGEGKLVVVWLGLPQDLIYYEVSTDQGRSWSLPQLIPGVWGGMSIYGTKLDSYTIATDGAGQVHLVLVGRTSGKVNDWFTKDADGRNDLSILNVLHLWWDGSHWSKPDVITTLVGDVPEWPRLAIGDGNQLHVVWFVRDKENIYGEQGRGEYRIWYAQGVSSAPAVVPVVWSTIPTTETSTPGTTAAPPMTVSPEYTALPTITTIPNYTESDILLLVIKALAPAAVLVALIVLVVFIRRR